MMEQTKGDRQTITGRDSNKKGRQGWSRPKEADKQEDRRRDKPGSRV